MKRIPVGDIELAVAERGEGAPLLLVHGFPLDHSMWAEQIDGLGDACRVIAPDLRGFGESGVTEGTVTMAQMADDLAACGRERFHRALGASLLRLGTEVRGIDGQGQ